MKLRINKWFQVDEMQVLAIGFIVLILVGAILLSLPISSRNGTYTNFIDSLFVSTSATCVTGLVTVDTGTHWSYFGKIVIMLLIQIGGLGFMSVATLFALLFGRKITLKERLIIHQSLNSFSIQGLVKMSKYILIFTFAVEMIGAGLLSTQFVPEFGWAKGLFYGVFHSISAFCNAGIDLIGEFRSVTIYSNNSVIILTISFLIIIGGLGFFVWQEVYNLESIKKMSLHSKLAISTTIMLILVGSILMFLLEMDNPNTIKNMPAKEKVLSSFFAAVVPRTAGFNSISTSDMSAGGKFLTIILMFIGGSPGSTAGGIKTTTMALLIMTVVSVVKGREDAEMYERRIGKELVYRALVVAVAAVTVVLISTMILSITEKGVSMEAILYESVSAFGTVGLTLGLTTKLSVVGKITIAIVMYVGRLGPLTIALSLVKRSFPGSIKYPKDKILIG